MNVGLISNTRTASHQITRSWSEKSPPSSWNSTYVVALSIHPLTSLYKSITVTRWYRAAQSCCSHLQPYVINGYTKKGGHTNNLPMHGPGPLRPNETFTEAEGLSKDGKCWTIERVQCIGASRCALRLILIHRIQIMQGKSWFVGLSSKLSARALTHLHIYILWKDKQINKETHFKSFNGKYTHQKGTKNKGAYMYPSTWDYQEDIYEFHSMQQDPSQKPSNFCKGRYISHKNVKNNKPNSHLNLYLFFEISMHVPGADCVEDIRDRNLCGFKNVISVIIN